VLLGQTLVEIELRDVGLVYNIFGFTESASSAHQLWVELADVTKRTIREAF